LQLIVLQGQNRETAMDFIERWCWVSPDGGDGTLELVCIGASADRGRYPIHRMGYCDLVSEAGNGDIAGSNRA
jgi:hypothetical protein